MLETFAQIYAFKGHGDGVANANNMEHFELECVAYQAAVVVVAAERPKNAIYFWYRQSDTNPQCAHI